MIHSETRFASVEQVVKPKTIYALYIELDIDALKNCYEHDYTSAYMEIYDKLINDHGFMCWKTDNMYYGTEDMNSISCMVAVIDLIKTLEWFRPSVRNIRLLRVESIDDLAPLVDAVQV